MNDDNFFKLYIPALEEALKNDSINDCFHVASPEFYVENKYIYDVDLFIESSTKYSEFFDMVAYYFDAKSHYFNEINGEDINIYKNRLYEYIEKYKKEFNI